MKAIQYTIRGVPAGVDRAAREAAHASNRSLNAVLVEVLSRGLAAEAPPEFHDLDDLAGSWVADPEFDRAMEMFETVDEGMWK